MEKKLLSAIANDKQSLAPLLSTNVRNELTEPAKIILDVFLDYYNNDSEATSIDLDIIKTNIERKYPKHAKALNSVVDTLSDVSTPNVLATFFAMKRNNIGMRLSSALLDQNSSLVEELLEQYSEVTTTALKEEENEDAVYIGAPLDFLGDTLDREFTLYPKSLQDRTDGAGRGHHILIYARPEVGKSLVSINLSTMFAKKGHRVLYVGNEDPVEDMLTRFVSRFTGLNKEEVVKNKEEAHKIAMANGYGNLIFKPLSPGTIPEIRGLIEKYRPDVLVVDQIRNLNVHMEGLVNILEKAATEIRNLAKKYNLLAMSVTQAGDSASNKLVLGMSDVDSSKTGLPAAIDLMIGVGMNDDFDQANRRMFSLAKNKLGGDHSFFSVQVDKLLSKVNSI